ncbi:MAG: transposase [Crocinitomicaceae bacterium]|nr:transposase [Crocinitomicaceae bacterium]
MLITVFSQDEAPKVGRPAFDRPMLFKALTIQSLYNLSDDQLEFQICGHASFKRFL